MHAVAPRTGAFRCTSASRNGGSNNTLNVSGRVNWAWTAHGVGDVFNNPNGASLTVYTT
jgi:hypothetical protein